MCALDAWAPLLYVKTKAWFKGGRLDGLNHAGVIKNVTDLWCSINVWAGLIFFSLHQLLYFLDFCGTEKNTQNGIKN